MEKRTAKKLIACMLSVSMAFGGIAAGVPNEAGAAAKKSVAVTAQAELDQALKDSKVTKITVKTDKAVSLAVKKGDYKSKTLVLSGAKITLKNAGKFKKISIHDAKQFTEKAANNTFSVTDPNTLKLTAAKNSKISEVRLNKSSEKATIVADGQVKAVSVNSASNCVMKGSTKKTVTVKVAEAGKGSTIKLAVPSAVKSKANAKITVSAGAEGAVVKAMKDGIKVSVINNSKGDIVLADVNGNKKTLESGKRASNADIASSSQNTVTFQMNDGSAAVYKTVSVTSGEKVPQPENPTRSGYLFDGWHTASEGGEKFNFDMAADADITLYAHWKEDVPAAGQKKVTFEWNYSQAGIYQTVSVNSGEKVAQPANPTRNGYVFNGWYTSANGGEKFDFNTQVTADVILYAHWNYSGSTGSASIGSGSTGSFVTGGGSTGGAGTGNGGSPGTGNGGSAGGAGTGNGGSSGTGNGGSTANPGPDTSEPSVYSVKFYWNDGSTNVYKAESVVPGNLVSQPANPERDGYTFEGWYKSSDLTMGYDFASSVGQDTDLYAKWKKNETSKNNDGVQIAISDYYERVTEMKQTLQGTFSGATDVLWTASDDSGEYASGRAHVDQGAGQWKIEDIQLRQGSNAIQIKAENVSNGNIAELDDITIIYDHGEMQEYSPEDITYFKDDAGNDTEEGYINNIIIVTLKNDSAQADREQARADREQALASVCEEVNGEVVGQINGALMYQIQVSAAISPLADGDNYGQLEELCEAAESASELVAVASCDLVQPEEDPIEMEEDPLNSIYQAREFIRNPFVPNDPWSGGQDWDESNPSGQNWWAEAVCAPSAWGYKDYFKKISIGIVDTGIKRGHEDLPDFTTVNENNIAAKHGTHVAGIIGAKDNNGKGITGMVWDKDLYNYDAYQGETTTYHIMDGVVSLVEAGCKVINNSNGGKYSSVAAAAGSGRQAAYTIKNLCERVREDFIIVCAAGNNRWDSRRNGSFCAIESGDALDHVIVVAAADKPAGGNYKLASFSNYGQYVTVAAPGAHIYSTVDFGNGYTNLNGTSMAAPIVTGITSLVWSVNEYLTARDVKQIIKDTSRVGIVEAFDTHNDGRTYDLVNAASAVEEAIRRTCGTGEAEGRFVDAVTGNGVPDVSYKIHLGTNDGEVVLEDSNRADGTFSFVMPAGEYVIEAYGNFVTSYTPVTVIPNDKVIMGDIPLTHALGSNTCRVVLEWGQYPRDLDSHLNANKKDNGQRIHVFYANRIEQQANLDRDDVDSYGPETVTVENFSELDGFTYSVHNYTYRNSNSGDEGAFNGQGSLAKSGATVKLYEGDTLLATYKVPENQAGTVWNVFRIDAGGQITTLNTFGYISDPREVGAGFVADDGSNSVEDVEIDKDYGSASAAAEGISMVSGDVGDEPESGVSQAQGEAAGNGNIGPGGQEKAPENGDAQAGSGEKAPENGDAQAGSGEKAPENGDAQAGSGEKVPENGDAQAGSQEKESESGSHEDGMPDGLKAEE